MNYRPEIDGLRAIAILPVMFFHAGFSFLSGGYVGVDIFFVISGYLITTLILVEKEAGNFILANFYERRARRILPALTFVVLVCLPIAYYSMMPTELKEFSQSLIAVSLFSSNIFFWLKTGYFMTAAELKPLLHTWSLAVEEQYYLLFPLLIALTWRYKKWVVLTLLFILGFASLALAQWRVVDHPGSTFFLLPTRLWEILIGSFVSFFLFYESRWRSYYLSLPSFVYQLLSLLGMTLILVSIIYFDDRTPFPSFYTLIPTVGTSLVVLFASEKTFVHKILSFKYLVGIGLISYSAYLWHQPIFAFARLISIKLPDDRQVFFLGILSLALAYLTWKYIEVPFRDRKKITRNRIFQFSLISLIIMVGIGSYGYLNQGFGNRLALNKMSYAELDLTTQPNFGLNKICDYESLELLEQCETSDTPEILVWGDSYAMHLIPGILASNPDVKLIQMTQNFCGPIMGMAPMDSRHARTWAEGCVDFNEGVVSWLEENRSVRYIVLSSPFAHYLGENDTLVDNKVITVDGKILTSQFITTLRMLSDMGFEPVVFAPAPTNGEDIGRCLMRAAIFGSGIDCRIEVGEYEEDRKDILSFLNEIEKEFPVIKVSDVLCGEVYCDTELDGVFIYQDSGHLSVQGSAFLGRKMDFYKLITSK